MAVTPRTGATSAFYSVSGATANYSDSEVLSAVVDPFYPTRTLYEITDGTKRYMVRSVTPVFHYHAEGAGDAIALSPTEIQYAGGRIVLGTALGATDTVHVTSGTYYTTITKAIGGSVAKLNDKVNLVEIPLLGNSYKKRFPTTRSWSVNLDEFMLLTNAEYSTAAGSNKDMTFWHTPGGTAGNDCSITLAAGTWGVSVTGTAVTVSIGSSKTANEIIALINASAACRVIGVHADLKTGSTGVGVPAAFTVQSLTGGLNLVDNRGKYGIPLIAIIYDTEGSDMRYEGYCWLESNNISFPPSEVIKDNLTFQSDDNLWYRLS